MPEGDDDASRRSAGPAVQTAAAPRPPSPDAEAQNDRSGQLGPFRTLTQLPRPVVALLAGTAVNRMASFVALFIVLYVTGLGYRPTQAGAVLSVYGLGSVLGAVAGGGSADRIGARRTIIVSMAVSALGTIAIGYATSLPALLVLGALNGAFTQFFRPAAASMLAELTPADRLVMTTAAGRLALNVGATVAPLAGVWLIGFGYRAAFDADAATSIAFAAVAYAVLPELAISRSGGRGRRGWRGRRGGSRQQAAVEALAATAASTPVEVSAAAAAAQTSGAAAAPAPGAPVAPGDSGYRAVLRDRRYALVVIAMFATCLAEIQYQSTLPLQISARGLSTAVYGAVVALNGLLVIAIELPLTPLLQRLPPRLPVAAGSAMIAGGIALFGLPGGAWLFLTGAAVWTLGEIVSAPSANAYPSLAAPRALRSRYIGAFTTAQTAGWAIGPSIGTALFEQGRGLVWILCAGLAVIAAAGMWFGIVPLPAQASSGSARRPDAG